MHWVINANIDSEPGYARLVQQLERSGTPFTVVRKVPFTDYLIAHDDRSKTPTPIELNLTGPVFITGSTSMKLVSARYGWNPGYIDAPSQDTLLQWFGDELLNADAQMGPLGAVEPISEEFFIRPVEDTKSFAGMTMDADGFRQWRDTIVAGGNDFVTLGADDQIMLAPLKRIYGEWRIFVVCGHIVTASRYKLGSRVVYSSDVDQPVLDYALRMLFRAEEALTGDLIKLHAGLRDRRLTFALDIAHTPDGYKVIETNSISSAGFYDCDMGKFVEAISWMA